MEAHILVIFDCSGSMNEPFQSITKTKKQSTRKNIKIDVAKERLIYWLNESHFDKATIIPFATRVGRKKKGSIHKSFYKIESFVNEQIADGMTNLNLALKSAISIASKEPNNNYIQYLIVTDGLSNTVALDFEQIKQIPLNQAVSGILIDPTDEGEEHLRKLCVRGSYMSVIGPQQFQDVLNQQNIKYIKRIGLGRDVQDLSTKNVVLISDLEQSEQRIKEYPKLDKKVGRVISQSKIRAYNLRDNDQEIMVKLANHEIEFMKLVNELNQLKQQQNEVEIIADLLRKSYEMFDKLNISVSHPLYLSKGYTTLFHIHIHPLDNLLKELNTQFRNAGLRKNLSKVIFATGLTVSVKLLSPEISFSEEITRKLEKGENTFSFNAKPKISLTGERQEVVISVYEKETNIEYLSKKISVEITKPFLGIPKPQLLMYTSIFLAIILIAMLFATVIGEINSLVGIILAVVAGLFAVFSLVYYRKCYVNLHRVHL